MLACGVRWLNGAVPFAFRLLAGDEADVDLDALLAERVEPVIRRDCTHSNETWIALALVVFSGWRPFRLLIGAYIFGGITILQLNLQAIGVNINIALLSMAPYLATILALVVISMSRFRGNRGAPGCLGRSFVKIT